MFSRGLSMRGMSDRSLLAITTSTPLRQSVQFASPSKGLGLARQNSKKILTSISTPDLERLAVEKKNIKSLNFPKR